MKRGSHGNLFVGRFRRLFGCFLCHLALLNLPFSAIAQSPLADAIESHSLELTQELLKENPDVNVPQSDGTTPLHWAVRNDDLPTAQRLIRAGAQVQSTNRYGVFPLALACQNGSAPMIDLLLKAGANPNTTLRGGETPLMTAARNGRPEAARLLLARNVDINAREKRGQTALMWAASEGHAEAAEELLRAGVDFQITLPDSGLNALFFAAREGRSRVIQALLKAGADVNSTAMPAKPGGKNVRKGTSALLLAVENGHFELASHLLALGADPNDQRSGFAPLHALTWVRKPNRGDGDDGDPAPIGSGNLNSLQLARELVAKGADVNLRLKAGRSGKGVLTRRGATPFLLAAVTADLGFLKLLHQLGADPNLANAENATPLMAAAGLGTMAPTEEAGTESEVIETVEFLLSLGADPNAKDDNGETAMHGAAYKNLPKVVDLLAKRGAKLDQWNHRNNYGWTPLRIAEGYRVGNYKPSVETVAALHQIFRNNGLTPPTMEPPSASDLSGDYTPAPKPAPKAVNR